jgi:hypothetical protein
MRSPTSIGQIVNQQFLCLHVVDARREVCVTSYMQEPGCGAVKLIQGPHSDDPAPPGSCAVRASIWERRWQANNVTMKIGSWKSTDSKMRSYKQETCEICDGSPTHGRLSWLAEL